MSDKLSNFDLQLFAAEDEGRTEQPTGRKIQRARERGQVIKSQELTHAMVVLVPILVLSLFSIHLFLWIYEHVKVHILDIHTIRLDSSLFLESYLFFFKVSLPVMLTAFITGLVVERLQVGPIFTLHPLKPQFSRIKPDLRRMLRRLFISKHTLVEFVKAIFKIVVISYICYSVIRREYLTLASLIEEDIFSGVVLIAKLTFEIIVKTYILLLILSLFDYLYQRHEYIESLKMTKQEVKEEWKDIEGDPLIKARQRERFIQIAKMRMMKKVPEADVVIRNPTHIAVAIAYNPSYMHAPIVLAMGKDFLALRIIEIAMEHNIPIVENRPLAEALYASCEIGEEIPTELYQAVAEVLAFVYRLKGKTKIG